MRSSVPPVDLVLFHAPNVYDFRQKTILYGPVSDLVPSSPIFEMYPIGLVSIAEYLERAGYRVRIVNLAVRMLSDPDFDVQKMVKSLDSPVYGIDLHWLPHAHGAIEVARMVKEHHPKSKLVFGGFTASYYHRELFQYPEIDYVLRGDTTEEPLRQLMDCILKGTEPEGVPNLSWRDNKGEVHENPLSHVPNELDDVMVNYYNHVVRSAVRYRNLANYLPFKRWLRYPITAVITCRGCTQNCVYCGGSAPAFRHILNRDRPAFRPPEAVANDVKRISHITKGPIFILGDIRQPGEDYAQRLLQLLARQEKKNQLILELFNPAPRDFLQQMGEACPGFCLEISPESHDPEVRRAVGKHYSNEALEETMEGALNAGCGRLDIYSIIGLPRQTPKSALDTIDYFGYLMDRFQSDKRLSFFTSPLAPFLDPGCLAFEDSEQHGYRVLFRSLEEHRKALLEPSWKYTLNYETEWMSRQDIVETTYEAGLRLNRLKAKRGLITKDVADATEERINTALDMLRHIDAIVASGSRQEEQLSHIKATVDRVSISTVCDKGELELPTASITLRPLRTLWSLVRTR
ncbi:TIGR04190 family B12-binding domain/radical SAM domain protein, partial [Chloroflexota bacterium]